MEYQKSKVRIYFDISHFKSEYMYSWSFSNKREQNKQHFQNVDRMCGYLKIIHYGALHPHIHIIYMYVCIVYSALHNKLLLIRYRSRFQIR